ncbi:MAG: insulinase family protein, partial [Pseudomonadota bacterium]|nr:insulinase family protein [Pseudomonadota bacterium]
MNRFALFVLFFWSFTAAGEVAVIQSPADANSYRSLVLDNGLKVLLVSDPEADKAAASVDIHTGSGRDPDDRKGLAHFLEHMLFLGTAKYPEAGEYQAFIQAHGGGNNAYTSFDHTNYYFDVSPEYLEPALDRFSQFFVAPLFTEEFVQRERNIVHSEYQARRKEDGRRLWAAGRQAMNPEHPMSRFSVGSVDTLADRPDDKVRDDLIDFYRKNYSAGIMTLAVVGREPLDQLQTWVREQFSKIPNTDAAAQSFPQPLYGDERLPARLGLVPEKDQHRVSFAFPIPSTFTHYAAKPVRYISNLLGHEGQGSLLSLLKEKGWAEGLSAGAGYMDEAQGTFEVSVALTAEGLNHIDEVGGLLFQMIRLIDEQDVEEWRYREEQQLAETEFRYREESDAASYARSLSASLQRYPVQDVLRGPYIMESYRPRLIRKFLGFLRPDNLLLTVVDKKHETDAVTPLYEVAYRLRALDKAVLESWRTAKIAPRLKLPPPNPFIPQDLAMTPAGDDGQVPQRVEKHPGIELWHQQDTSFGAPRAGFYFSVQSPLASESARSVVLTELYARMVQDQLTELSYPAYLAGLEYQLYRHSRGVSVRINGYSDKQQVLL